MTFDDYKAALDDLREEYASSIKGYAGWMNGIELIDRVQVETEEYRLRVEGLKNQYRRDPQLTI